MRPLVSRRAATAAVCAALVLGTAGPAAATYSAHHAAHSAGAEALAPVPGADALTSQTKALGDVGGVLAPVTDLLTAVLKADGGKLTPDQVTENTKAVKDALDK
ncbi:hypothetical protein HY68_14220, partial [Streptomyces sp. AcH 505]